MKGLLLQQQNPKLYKFRKDQCGSADRYKHSCKDLNFEETRGFILSADGKEAYVLIGTKLVKFGL